jgi:hypothetical protein
MEISLWRSCEEAKKQANITQFITFVNNKYGLIIDVVRLSYLTGQLGSSLTFE